MPVLAESPRLQELKSQRINLNPEAIQQTAQAEIADARTRAYAILENPDFHDMFNVIRSYADQGQVTAINRAIVVIKGKIDRFGERYQDRFYKDEPTFNKAVDIKALHYGENGGANSEDNWVEALGNRRDQALAVVDTAQEYAAKIEAKLSPITKNNAEKEAYYVAEIVEKLGHRIHSQEERQKLINEGLVSPTRMQAILSSNLVSGAENNIPKHNETGFNNKEEWMKGVFNAAMGILEAEKYNNLREIALMKPDPTILEKALAHYHDRQEALGGNNTQLPASIEEVIAQASRDLEEGFQLSSKGSTGGSRGNTASGSGDYPVSEPRAVGSAVDTGVGISEELHLGAPGTNGHARNGHKPNDVIDLGPAQDHVQGEAPGKNGKVIEGVVIDSGPDPKASSRVGSEPAQRAVPKPEPEVREPDVIVLPPISRQRPTPGRPPEVRRTPINAEQKSLTQRVVDRLKEEPRLLMLAGRDVARWTGTPFYYAFKGITSILTSRNETAFGKYSINSVNNGLGQGDYGFDKAEGTRPSKAGLVSEEGWESRVSKEAARALGIKINTTDPAVEARRPGFLHTLAARIPVGLRTRTLDLDSLLNRPKV